MANIIPIKSVPRLWQMIQVRNYRLSLKKWKSDSHAVSGNCFIVNSRYVIGLCWLHRLWLVQTSQMKTNYCMRGGCQFRFLWGMKRRSCKVLVLNSSESDAIWLRSTNLSKLISTWFWQHSRVGRRLCTFRLFIWINPDTDVDIFKFCSNIKKQHHAFLAPVILWSFVASR